MDVNIDAGTVKPELVEVISVASMMKINKDISVRFTSWCDEGSLSFFEREIERLKKKGIRAVVKKSIYGYAMFRCIDDKDRFCIVSETANHKFNVAKFVTKKACREIDIEEERRVLRSLR